MSLENLDPQAAAELAALAKTLADNPETRKEFLRLTKKARPDVVLPELEIEDAVSSQLSTRDEKIANLEKELAERKLSEDMERARAAIKAQGITDDELPEVEKLMVEKGIADHQTAAEYWSWQQKAQQATERAMQAQQPKQMVSPFKDFFTNPVQRAREEAFKVLQEGRRPVRPAGL